MERTMVIRRRLLHRRAPWSLILQNGFHPRRQLLSGELLPRLAGGERSRVLVRTAHLKARA